MNAKVQDSLQSKKILVAATGSIAAVKTTNLVSNLIKAGAEVRCVLTPSAAQLISPLAVSTLSRNICYQDQDQWNQSQTKPLHIELAEWAELIVVAPLSATTLSKYVHGNAEGLLASVLLASEKPIIFAAAMNTSMWKNKYVQRNWELVTQSENLICLGPSAGLLACDRIGEGKMISIEVIQLAIRTAFIYINKKILFKKDFQGLQLLVTAGPTIEKLDSARYLSNRSSGKMGLLIAHASKLRGANVNLIHGPLKIEESFLEGLNASSVTSTSEMQRAIKELQPEMNVIIMAAAVADIKMKENLTNQKPSKDQLIKSFEKGMKKTPDLLAEINSKKNKYQIVMGFTALTGSDREIQILGEAKRVAKACDFMMANPIDRENQGFEENFNSGVLLKPNKKSKVFPITTKLTLAHELLDEIIQYELLNS